MSLGPHVILPTAAAVAWAQKAPVVKVLDQGWVFLQARPDALCIFRHFFASQDINRNGADVADEVLHYLADGPATHIELFNEVASKLGQGLERHVAMTAEAVARVQQVRPDLTVIGLSIATGNIEQADWDYLRAHKFGNLKVVGWHCYWGNQGYSQWHALRYRSYWKPGDPLLALTEIGRDKVEGGKGGYKLDGLSPSQFAGEVNGFVAETAKDAYVIAVTPFTSGPTADWDAFDMDPVSAMLNTTSTPATGGHHMIPGIDVSNHQGTIDWPLVARCGPQFAVIKATESTDYLDPYFAANWQKARDAGLVRGAYGFGRPSRGSGKADANYFLSAVKDIQQGDFLVLDLEDEKVAPTADLLAYTLDWLRTVESAVGFKPLLYSGHYYLAPHNCEGHAELAAYGLWLASYQSTLPPVPKGWDWFAMWQYSDRGVVPGIGACDVDLFNGSLEQLRKYGKP